MRLLLTWLINAATLLAIPYVLPGVSVSSFGAALVAALVLGLANTLVRPVLVLLTLPVTIVTLGLFILVINAFLFWLVAYVIEGFQVASFGNAFIGALIYSVLSTLISWLILPDRK
jgi:putative membrane protein